MQTRLVTDWVVNHELCRSQNSLFSDLWAIVLKVRQSRFSNKLVQHVTAEVESAEDLQGEREGLGSLASGGRLAVSRGR